MAVSYEDILEDGQKKKYFLVKEATVEYIAQSKSDQITDPEEQVRIGLFYDLIEKYGYKNSKDVIDIEIYRKIGHPHKKSDTKADIIVYKDGNPFMMFELKSPEEYEKYLEESIKTQLFERAATEDKAKGHLKYLIYYTRWYEDRELKEKFVTIDYEKYKTFEEWDEAQRPNLRIIPAKYGIIDKPPRFVKGSKVDLRQDVHKDELDRIARELHNILWGGGKYQNELFFNLIGLFLVKIYDEKETEKGKPYNFQIFYEGNNPEKPEKVYDRMNELYKKALKDYLKYSKEEVKKVKDIVFDAPKVKYVVESLQDISFTVNKYDVLGDFFEKIVRSELKQTKGQYLTHTNIVDFIVRALEIENLSIELINNEKRLPYIIDPACGSGTFLIQAMKLITHYCQENSDKIKKSDAVQEKLLGLFPKYRPNRWAEDFIYGLEINGDLAMAAKVNMVGHGDGSAHIEAKDGLLDFNEYGDARLKVKINSKIYPKPVNEQFDIIISNPPFSITVDRDTAKKFPDIFIQGEKIAHSLKKDSKKQEIDTENLFIERWYQFLKPKGRLGVVLPESVFDTTTNREIRLFLYKHFYIRAVVSLPHLAFAPYTMTKTSLLFAQKKTAEEIKKWDELWKKYEAEYKDLKNNLKKLLDTKKKSKPDKEDEKKKAEFVSILKSLLKDNFNPEDESFSFDELKEKYEEEIKQADLEWWVFGKVASTEGQNYPIFMAHAEEIGYKRGLRGEEKRENQLFDVITKSESEHKVIINTNNPQKILDYLRKSVIWNS